MTATPPPRGVPAVLRSLVVAFGFLTRLPVPTVEWRDEDLRRSLPAFPLVGLVIGGLAAVVYAGAWQVLPPLPAAVLAVAVAVAVTGGFHEDGLADTFDGFFGGYESGRRLQIMHDSRIGTFGGAALVLSLVLRVSLLAALTPARGATAVIGGHVLGRGAILLAAPLSRPADPTSSGAAVVEPAGPVGLVVGALITLVPVGLLVGPAAWVPIVAGTAVCLAWVVLSHHRVGGVTGDVLGATNQLVHLTTMACVVALARAGWL